MLLSPLTCLKEILITLKGFRLVSRVYAAWMAAAKPPWMGVWRPVKGADTLFEHLGQLK